MFVPIIEILWMRMPYTSHKVVPMEAMKNMVKETSFVDFDFQVLIT